VPSWAGHGPTYTGGPGLLPAGCGHDAPTLGSAIAQAAYAVAVRAATELLTSGTYDSVADGIAYDTMNDAITARTGTSG
jgi:hypothetical protein